MWEFEIEHTITGERTIIFGYNFSDACRRHELNPNEWDVLLEVYVD